MTFVATPQGLAYPYPYRTSPIATSGVGAALAASGNAIAMIGHCYIQGRAASKTISSSGGKIYWFAGSSVTFANAGTTIDVGIQDVDTTTGSPARPDGTMDVKKTLTGGTDTITASAENTATMSTGTKTISHGDLIAIVLRMTARGGADSVTVGYAAWSFGSYAIDRPLVATTTDFSTWSARVGGNPCAYIQFDDGTFGILDYHAPFWPGCVSSGSFSAADSNNPDENGLIFQVPWACKIDALFCVMDASIGVNSDCDLKLYSDPTGTPTLITSASLLGENSMTGGNSGFITVQLASEVQLSASTDYCLSVKATSSSAVSLSQTVLMSTNLFNFLPGGTTLKKATRNDSTGAFTPESPAVTLPILGVRISQLHDSSTGGGGGHIIGGSVIR